jgi:hypothetical protein
MRRASALLFAIASLGCSTKTEDPCAGSGALASCLKPTKDAAYYVAQAELYFDTLDYTKDPEKVPFYSPRVVRWEWYPWLKLTAYGRAIMVQGNKALTIRDKTTSVPVKDCRAFEKQPFARCYVEFDYAGKRCPIYEEFFFNDKGETTWVEAWSVLPGKHPMPMRSQADRWAEGSDVVRLGDKIPTLGGPAGDLDIDDDAFRAAAARDPEIQDLFDRATNFTQTLTAELNSRPSEEEMYADGCGWPAPVHGDAGAAHGGAGDAGP